MSLLVGHVSPVCWSCAGHVSPVCWSCAGQVGPVCWSCAGQVGPPCWSCDVYNVSKVLQSQHLLESLKCGF